MKHFPIYSQGVFLGAIICFKYSGSWHLQYVRDDRPAPVFTLAEIAQMITAGSQEYGMLLSKIGYVIHDIEHYTSCPLTSIPRLTRKKSSGDIEIDIRNPLLHYAKTKGRPWVADFMLPWVEQGKIVFADDVPEHSRFIFRIEESRLHPQDTRVIISGSSTIIYSSFSGDCSELHNVQATFCQFHSTRLRNHSLHNGYIFGADEELRVCQ